MKTAIKNFALALALITGLNINAADFNVAVNEAYTVTVSSENVNKQGTIVLTDSEGNVLYNKMLKNTKELLNLKNLPNGTYELAMENDLLFKRTSIVKSVTGLSVTAVTEGTIFKPSFKKEGSVLRMSLTNPTEQKATFSVYDAKGMQVASTEGSDFIIKKSFDFTGRPNGDYTIKTNVAGQSFYQDVEIN